MGVQTDVSPFESIFQVSDFSKSVPQDRTPGPITNYLALESFRKSVGPIPGGLEVPIHGPSVSPIASPTFTCLGTPEISDKGLHLFLALLQFLVCHLKRIGCLHSHGLVVMIFLTGPAIRRMSVVLANLSRTSKSIS